MAAPRMFLVVVMILGWCVAGGCGGDTRLVRYQRGQSIIDVDVAASRVHIGGYEDETLTVAVIAQMIEQGDGYRLVVERSQIDKVVEGQNLGHMRLTTERLLMTDIHGDCHVYVRQE